MTGLIKTWKLPLITISVTVIIVLFVFISTPPPKQKPQVEYTAIVQTTPAIVKNYPPYIQAIGKVKPKQTSTLSSTVNAFVDQVLATDGDTVTQGQTLIKLKEDDLSQNIATKKAEIHGLKADIAAEIERHKVNQTNKKEEKKLLDIAKRNVNRQQQLMNKNVGAKATLDRMRAELARQQLRYQAILLEIKNHPNNLALLNARLKQAQAALKIAENDIKKSTIKAPYTGKIITRFVSTGERVMPGMALISLYDTDDIEITTEISNKFITKIEEKKPIDIHATAMARKHLIKLTFDRLSGHIEPGQIGQLAYFKVTDGEIYLSNNLKLVLNITLPSEQAIAVPPDSLFRNKWIYIIDGDSRLKPIDVTITGQWLDESGKRFLLIQSDQLKPTDQIITTHLPQAREGLKVTVHEPKASN